MALRNLSISATSPTRAEAWQLFNEAWGYYTGSILLTEITYDAKLREDQIQFRRNGHSHPVGGAPDGIVLSEESLRKQNFDLNGCLACWLDLWNEVPGRVWALLTGSGTIDCGTVSGDFFTGSVALDFNPAEVAAPDANCVLDIRAMDTYSFSNSTVDWTYYAAWASPTEPSSGAEGSYAVVSIRTMDTDDGDAQVGPGTTIPGFLATATEDLPTLTFDYWVLIYRNAISTPKSMEMDTVAVAVTVNDITVV